MTVDEFAEALGSKNLRFVEDGQYRNVWEQSGYWAIYRDAERCLRFSVSATEIRLAADEVATAITAPGRYVARANPYLNRKGQLGFEATVHSGGHAFMLNAAPDPSRFFRAQFSSNAGRRRHRVTRTTTLRSGLAQP